jgi:enolase
MIGHSIKSVKAREILDSRGYPTIEVELKTGAGIFTASVPSGTSTGEYEAKELRDGGSRYLGMGVNQAIDSVNLAIAPKLIGKNPQDQKAIDDLMIEFDGTKDKSRLGANAILGVSIAVLNGSPNWPKPSRFCPFLAFYLLKEDFMDEEISIPRNLWWL